MAISIAGLARPLYCKLVKLPPFRERTATPGSSLDRGLNEALGFRRQTQRFEYLRQAGIPLTRLEQKLIDARNRLHEILYGGGAVKPGARMQVQVAVPEIEGVPILPEPIANEIRGQAEEYFGDNDNFVDLVLAHLMKDPAKIEQIISDLEAAFQCAVEHGYSLRKLIPALYHYLNVTENPNPFSVIPSAIREAVDMGREPGEAILMSACVIGGLSDEAETMRAWHRMETSFWNRVKKRISEIFVLERFFSLKYNRWFGVHNPFGSMQSKAADPYINTATLRRLLLNPETRGAALQNIFGREICKEILDEKKLEVFNGRDVRVLSGELELYKIILAGDFTDEIKERVVDKFIETINIFLHYPRMGEIAAQLIRLVIENPDVTLDLKEKMLICSHRLDYIRREHHAAK